MSSNDWLHQAACTEVDSELFFPIGSSPDAIVQGRDAKRICNGCPVRPQCLEWALNQRGLEGIFGGTDESQRRNERRRRREESDPGAVREAYAWCGTPAGYKRHRRRGETPCDDCRGAQTEANRRYAATGTTRAAS